ncbi:MAG TPA: hypothetical protein DE060_17930 [Lentisphaeria bacterium]|nr:hypothetical protein [Lentisphaeria bacterium]HCG51072.1 hypothetical protein [Lentisphaeria bacterium]
MPPCIGRFLLPQTSPQVRGKWKNPDACFISPANTNTIRRKLRRTGRRNVCSPKAERANYFEERFAILRKRWYIPLLSEIISRGKGWYNL